MKPNPLSNLLARFQDVSSPWGLVVALSLALLVGICDLRWGEPMSLRFLYVPSVMWAAWNGRSLGGMAVVLLATLFSFAKEQIALGSGEWAAMWSFTAVGEAGNVLALLGCVAFVTAHCRHAIDREHRLARTDPLTGLSNARAFQESLDAERNRCRRTGRPITVAFIDCDNFKQVNDTKGHLAGDAVLKQIAFTMRSELRNYDQIARLGGDEFGVILPETNAETGPLVVRRVHERLSQAMTEHQWPVTFSIGVVTYLHMPRTADEMIRRADELMYDVKGSGKQGVRFECLDEPMAPEDLERQ